MSESNQLYHTVRDVYNAATMVFQGRPKLAPALIRRILRIDRTPQRNALRTDYRIDRSAAGHW
jgi:hypothetical protein